MHIQCLQVDCSIYVQVRNKGMVYNYIEGICSRERLPEDERSSGVCKFGIRRYNASRKKSTNHEQS